LGLVITSLSEDSAASVLHMTMRVLVFRSANDNCRKT
jgi:hypothetical protein